MASKPIAEKGPIRDGESYSLEVFKRRTGLSAWQLHEAKCAGLKVRHFGKQGYVLGSDWLAFLGSLGCRRSAIYPWLFLAGLFAKLIAFWITTKK